MTAPRNRKHIFVACPPRVEPYKPHPRTMKPDKPPPPLSRADHGQVLGRAFHAAIVEANNRREEARLKIQGAEPGLYVQFEGQPGYPLQVRSLEAVRKGIEVVAVSYAKTEEAEPASIERATVFVPDEQAKHFFTRFESYSKTTPKKKMENRYEDLVDSISSLRLANLRGLWTDASESYPEENETIWWEVWLRRQDGNELERLMEFAAAQEIDVAERRLMFDDRIVTLVRAAPFQLAASIDVLNDVAEVRKAKEVATVFVDMGPEEQAEWVKELCDRLTPPSEDAPAVCVLDTGVTRGHPLLSGALDAGDCHTCEPAWGVHDHRGHGTEMAGLALFGDMTPVLSGTQHIELRHRLESVKILPPQGRPGNPPELYGAITAEAANRAEIAAPARRRAFSMSVTATDERDRGQPTSWSAAIDALASGRSFDMSTKELNYIDDGETPMQRLFVLSAGNVDGAALCVDHLDRSDIDPIHDPGQAWNALTVGAVTEKTIINDPTLTSWQPVAKPGDLSPYSTTGVAFAEAWPLKPDVVFEGGNVIKNDKGEIDFPCADLSLLTTHFKPSEKSFVCSWATSAATAQAARLATLISVEYPNYWPETLRALVVHSAEWTAEMEAQHSVAKRKSARAQLIQRYGYGVPSVERALRSANDALTLVVQSSICPFNDTKMRELHFFDLPWPREVLTELGETQVQLRVTLSYFIEPNPGRRGWKTRHRYASHGLRFEVKGPTESFDEFRKRLNKQALEGDEAKPGKGSEALKWYLGEQARSRGSLHSDFLSCTAANLAECGVIAVYPVSGWWKDQPKRDRSDKGVRYALVVSIETPAVDADIWTPVAAQAGVAVEVAH